MEKIVGKNMGELPIVDKDITCYKDGQGKKVYQHKKYNLNIFPHKYVTQENDEYFEVSGFGCGWFKKFEAFENYTKEPNYEVY